MDINIQDLINKFIVNEEELKGLLIKDQYLAIGENSCRFGYYELMKAAVIHEIDKLKLEYKLWLADKKKEMDRKIYNTELAKEDAVIAKYRTEYLQYNKKIIDLTYQQNVLTGLAKAVEMRANLLISLNNEDKEKTEIKIGQWNTKVEKTKI